MKSRPPEQNPSRAQAAYAAAVAGKYACIKIEYEQTTVMKHSQNLKESRL
ncbi:MAG: hypothetical protein ACLVCE_01605 [Anaerovoracaceae bacterium]|nr:hypothetical protein [Bacillota bacterium]